MTLVKDLLKHKIYCQKKGREYPASEKFYLIQEGVWDDAFHMAREQISDVYEIIKEIRDKEYEDEATDAYDKCLSLIHNRLLGGVE